MNGRPLHKITLLRRPGRTLFPEREEKEEAARIEVRRANTNGFLSYDLWDEGGEEGLRWGWRAEGGMFRLTDCFGIWFFGLASGVYVYEGRGIVLEEA